MILLAPSISMAFVTSSLFVIPSSITSRAASTWGEKASVSAVPSTGGMSKIVMHLSVNDFISDTNRAIFAEFNSSAEFSCACLPEHSRQYALAGKFNCQTVSERVSRRATAMIPVNADRNSHNVDGSGTERICNP